MKKNVVHNSCCLILRFLIAVFLVGCEIKIQETISQPLQPETRQITNDHWPKRDLAWSPDGRRIAYTAERERAEFFRLSRETSEPSKYGEILDYNFSTRPALSPDGLKLAYVPENEGHVWVFDFQEHSTKLLTAEQMNAIEPSWSHDGKWLAYAAKDSAFSHYSIWTIGANGENARQITSPAQMSARAPTWSPDGTQIAFETYAYRPDLGILETKILTVLLASGETRVLISNLSGRAYPDWSPDGTKIAFQTRHDNGISIWIASAADGRTKELTQPDVFATYPSWSPDGSKIAFESDHGLGILSFPQGVRYYLVEAWRFPMWLPDGESVLAIRSSVFSQLSVVDLENTQIALPTAAAAYPDDRQPCWFPDSDRIAFVRVTTSEEEEMRVVALATGEDVSFFEPPPTYSVQNPAVSPNGMMLACDNGTTTYIYLQSAGWLPRLDADLYDQPVQPTWSPDGKQVACTTYSGLRIFDVQENRIVFRVYIPGRFQNPSWSVNHPNLGAHIALEQNHDIYVLSPSNPKPELVIQAGRHPSWSPDGTKLAYVHNRNIYVSTVFLPFAN